MGGLFASERLGPACVYGSNEEWDESLGSAPTRGLVKKRRYIGRFVTNPPPRGRFTAIPARRGNRSGVGATLRNT
jgi:hypothetical protein